MRPNALGLILLYSGLMRKVILISGEIVEVSNNEAHRLIDQEGAKLVSEVPVKTQYDTRMLKAGRKYGAKVKRSYNSR